MVIPERLGGQGAIALFQRKNHRPGYCVSDAEPASQVLKRVAE